MNKYLIINADDYGFSEKTNQGIIEAYTKGGISDLSIMAVGTAFEDGIKRLKENSITTAGIHVCLTTDLRPLRMEYFPKNCFSLFKDIVLGRVKKRKIYAEIKAQIKKVKEQGINISHIDSHEHVHMFLPITGVFMRIADEEKIPYTRYPNEKIDLRFAKEPVNFIRSIMLKTMCFFSKNTIKRKISGNFFGHFHSGSITKKDVQEWLRQMPAKVNELGCHPGYDEKSSRKKDIWRKNAQKELDIFTDKEVIAQIKNFRIKTVSFKDLETL